MRNRKPEVSKKEKQNQRRRSSRHGGGRGADPRVCPGSWTRAGETRSEPWGLGSSERVGRGGQNLSTEDRVRRKEIHHQEDLLSRLPRTKVVNGVTTFCTH